MDTENSAVVLGGGLGGAAEQVGRGQSGKKGDICNSTFNN